MADRSTDNTGGVAYVLIDSPCLCRRSHPSHFYVLIDNFSVRSRITIGFYVVVVGISSSSLLGSTFQPISFSLRSTIA